MNDWLVHPDNEPSTDDMGGTTVSYKITPEIAAQAALLAPDDFLIEEDHYCGSCGEPFEPGQQVLSVHAPYADIGTHRAIEDIHLRCYQGEEVPTDFHDVSCR